LGAGPAGAVPFTPPPPTSIQALGGSFTTEFVMRDIVNDQNSQLASTHYYNISAQQTSNLNVPSDTNCNAVTYNNGRSIKINTTNGSTTVVAGPGTSFANTDTGSFITGTGIPNPANNQPPTTTVTFVDATHLTLSVAATATSVSPITAALSGPGAFFSPNGSSAGRRALRDSVAGIYPTSAATSGGTKHGCLDIARTSADFGVPDTTVDPTHDEYYAFALDQIAVASPSLSAPAQLTVQEVRDIYSCKITDWSQLPGGGSGQIQRVMPQASSGTGATFVAKWLGGVAPVASGTNCPAMLQPEENRGDVLADSTAGGNPALLQQMILPFSGGVWSFMAQNAANPSLDLRNGVRVIATITSPSVSGGASDPTVRSFSDLSTTSGTANVSSLGGANFTYNDVGLGISDGAVNIPAGSRIIQVTDSKNAVISQNASNTASNVSVSLKGFYADPTSAVYAVRWAGSQYQLNENGTAISRFAVDASTNGTTTITSASGGFRASMIGETVTVGSSLTQFTITGQTATTLTVNNPVPAGSSQALFIQTKVADESNPSVTDSAAAWGVPAARYLYNELSRDEPSYTDARNFVGFDATTANSNTKSQLCGGTSQDGTATGYATTILSYGFRPLSAQTTANNNAGVICRLVHSD
jgi:hypothetical protein